MTQNMHGKLHPSQEILDQDNAHRIFHITSNDLSLLCEERTHQSFAQLLKRYLILKSSKTPQTDTETNESEVLDLETPDAITLELHAIIHSLESEANHDVVDSAAELASLSLVNNVLHSSTEKGITTSQADIEHRRAVFGTNAIPEKKLTPFLVLCFEAVQDFVLIMLIIMAILEIIIASVVPEKNGKVSKTGWIEGVAILVAVMIVVLVSASLDYAKQFTFKRLTKSLDASNLKVVIRNGEKINVTDAEIVVGDVLLVNSHNLATIPADCVVLSPSGGLKMDESSLTGESKLISKKPGDVILSGTNAVEGTGKMIVVAVGTNSVSGKIKARVYESGKGGELSGDDEEGPLFTKLTKLAKTIGLLGTLAAVSVFVVSSCIGLIANNEPTRKLINYLVLAITVLAVAVPEGLPLAVTLALAYSSNKMMKEQNLVKHLEACETMGCATTICTDKTGTLTANKMTARALFTSLYDFSCLDPSMTLGNFVLNSSMCPHQSITNLIGVLISIDTMNETVLSFENGKVKASSGNPTEIALLQLVHELRHDYRDIRNSTRGRSDVYPLADHLHEGKQVAFSSARKIMSWIVPAVNGGYRIYSKGASEVIIGRCVSQIVGDGQVKVLGDDSVAAIVTAAEQYARRGMRCIGLAYRDVPEGFDLERPSDSIKDSDGSNALEVETNLTFVALVGIEDPLRAEVPRAIQECYRAGIDVRLVTGDSPNTAVSIAYQAGILREMHFALDGKDHTGSKEMVAANLKENVLMEGKEFRNRVFKILEDGTKEFDQAEFDKIWPHLRVLARSSPDDKLTLAHGLNQSTLYLDKELCAKLKNEHNITIFPDRQVIAMTGDGTNDAPALKRADIGFAMGIAGTQIAKDAADIILLDDNFASIVTAAKWGRNVYASIQKFIQFQLTVNLSAVVTALVGGFTYQVSPLAAIHLLWVNLLMDSLASLALASEPPTEKLLQRPPVNRSKNIITKRMAVNIFGQFSYQIVIMMVLLFIGPSVFNVLPGNIVEDDGKISEHYTIMFNSYVWMQLFNEINCRNLDGEVNVFRGFFKNPLFCAVLGITAAAQYVIVEFGGDAMHVYAGGLSAKYWGISIAFGVGSLIMQQVINAAFWIGAKLL